MKYKNIIGYIFLAIFLIFYITKWKNYNDIYFSDCLNKKIVYKIKPDKLYTQDALEKEFKINIKKQDYRFFCILGVSYHCPGLSLKKHKKLIKKYGYKLVCTDDVIYNNQTHRDYKEYNYFLKYNKKLLNFLKMRF